MRAAVVRAILAFYGLAAAGSAVCRAEEGAGEPLFQPVFEMTGEGLTYALHGGSVVSQGRLEARDRFEVGDLPAGGSVVKAFLYWAGELQPRKSADTRVELTGPGGETTVVDADSVRTLLVSGLVYACRADVTRLITGNGSYEVAHVGADPLGGSHTLGGWGLVVVLKDPALKSASTVRILDGLFHLPAQARSKTVLEVRGPPGGRPSAADVGLICGFGRPWDGGSARWDGVPLSGREDFAGTAGFSWDVSRNLVPLEGRRRKHELEFIPDDNAILPLALVVRFTKAEKADVLRLAEFYVRRADRVEELAFFDPQDSALRERELLVKAYLRELFHEKAISLLSTAPELPLEHAGRLHPALGRLYLREGRLDLAEREFREAARAGERGAEIALGLAQIAYERGDLERAIRLLEKEKETSRANALIFRNLGMCYLQMGELDSAAGHFEEAVRLDPAKRTPYRFLADLYGRRGDTALQAYTLERMKELAAEPAG